MSGAVLTAVAERVRLDYGSYSRPWVGLDSKNRPYLIDCPPRHGDDPLCHYCQRQLAAVLADVPALLHDLAVSEVRDTRFVEHGSTITDVERAPSVHWIEQAARTRHRIVRLLEQLGELVGIDQPARVPFELPSRLGQLGRHPASRDLAARLSHAVRSGHDVIDRPPSLSYYGPCPRCRRDIYLDRVEEHERLFCPNKDCTYTATLKQHRVAQLHAGEDRWLTVDELVGAITKAGEPVTRRQIERMIRTGGLPRDYRELPTIAPDGTITSATMEVFRLGDVLDVVDAGKLSDTLTSAEVQNRLGVRESTVRQWVSRSELIPLRKNAKPLRFRLSVVEEFERRRAERPRRRRRS